MTTPIRWVTSATNRQGHTVFACFTNQADADQQICTFLRQGFSDAQVHAPAKQPTNQPTHKARANQQETRRR